MRISVLSCALLISSFATAQVVHQVNGPQALVKMDQPGVLAGGDEVTFYSSQLEEAGRGQVIKTTPNGTQAVVKITSGKIKKGMVAEKISPPEKAEGPKYQTSYESLSPEERRILQNGPINDTRYIIGGILGTYPLGFGIGHAIQGRYADRGWVFTAGEAGSLAVLFAGVGSCLDHGDWNSERNSCNGGLMFLGLFGYVGFRVWEIIDVWAIPPQINRRYRELKSRLGERVSFEPFLLPQADGGRLGLRMRW
ncbi:MAG: hypothetical protein KF865_13670 [Bdellovibrionaceae bacterium]|nr:hypothetical protein [Pseudobdellovibrionaceae bacterium]